MISYSLFIIFLTMSLQVEPEKKQARFKTLLPFLRRKSPFVPESPINQDFPAQYFSMNFPILVIGAGGLGCEILKNLALSGFQTIHIIDLDTIDLSNLNRQFLFRLGDVGKSKAQVAADFVKKRVPTVDIIPHCCKIQDLDDSFYEQFSIIIAGLDNVEARRWLNQKVHALTEFDEDGEIVPESRKVFIDGGTEKFNGQVLVVKPYETSCYECIVTTLPKQKIFNSCTIANIPRIPEHCIQYAKQILWQQEFGADKKIDTDSKEDILWLYNKAKERAEGYNIKGVTEQLTLGVIKNIIPAIASTNCLIAAACTNEAFKIATGTNPNLNNLYYFKGMSLIGSDTYVFEQEKGCIVCSKKFMRLRFQGEKVLKELEVELMKELDIEKGLSILTNKGFLINKAIEQLAEYHSLKLNELVEKGVYVKGDQLHVSFKDKSGKNRTCVVNLELLSQE